MLMFLGTYTKEQQRQASLGLKILTLLSCRANWRLCSRACQPSGRKPNYASVIIVYHRVQTDWWYMDPYALVLFHITQCLVQRWMKICWDFQHYFIFSLVVTPVPSAAGLQYTPTHELRHAGNGLLSTFRKQIQNPGSNTEWYSFLFF